MKPSSYFVYGLVDPSKEEVFYVGVTRAPERRYRQHMSGKGRQSKALKDKLRQLMEQDIKPSYTVFEETDKESALERENYWMRFLTNQDAPLVNAKVNRSGKTANFKDALNDDQRRELILSALSGTPVIQLSKEYGVARSWIYVLVDDAKLNPLAAVREAEEELWFRKQVRDLI